MKITIIIIIIIITTTKNTHKCTKVKKESKE